MKIILLALLLFVAMPSFADTTLSTDTVATGTSSVSDKFDANRIEANHHYHHPRYDWGRGNNGWGYCYQWTHDGYVLNEGRPVPEYHCERRRPSHFAWGRAMNGYTYCYQWTPYRVVMNEGRPVPNHYCY